MLNLRPVAAAIFVCAGMTGGAHAGFDITHRECVNIMAKTYEAITVMELNNIKIRNDIFGDEKNPSEPRAALFKLIQVKSNKAAREMQDFMDELRPYCQSLRR